MSRQSNSGLQHDLSSSIAVKITAPVLWIIIAFGVFIAVYFQENVKQNLADELTFTADYIAYELQSRLNKSQWELSVDDRLWLRERLQNTEIKSVTLTTDRKITSIGDFDEGWESLERSILQYKSTTGEITSAKLILKHPPLKALIKSYRREMLVKTGIPFLLFAIALATLIHFSVTRPITELVEATKSVTKGDLSTRIEITREDEFGHLGKFMNEMLEKLQNQQQQLSKSVAAAEAASTAKSSFLANMSHEIRTPLTAIIGFSEVLREKDLTEEQRKLEIDAIIRSGIHLQEIINDILDFSKIEAGQLVIENIAVSPIEVLDEVRSLFASRAEVKGLRLNVEIEFPFPHKIYTDPTRLKQILINLCSNAVKFTEEGSVSMLARYLPQTNKLLVSVTDTGLGMDENEQKQIFLPFTQADVSTSRQFGGTGLGLCISNEIAVKLGGEIRCTSKKQVGTQFVVEVDAGDPENVQLFNSREEIDRQADSKDQKNIQSALKGRVLLAEDNIDNQRLLGFYLKRAGLDFVVAENGAAAVRFATSEHFDLVLMDMQMPVMDGLSAIRLLRQQKFEGPIVVLTANALAEDRSACEEAGANDFLTKPVDVQRFNAVLDEYLDNTAA